MNCLLNLWVCDRNRVHVSNIVDSSPELLMRSSWFIRKSKGCLRRCCHAVFPRGRWACLRRHSSCMRVLATHPDIQGLWFDVRGGMWGGRLQVKSAPCVAPPLVTDPREPAINLDIRGKQMAPPEQEIASRTQHAYDSDHVSTLSQKLTEFDRLHWPTVDVCSSWCI